MTDVRDLVKTARAFAAEDPDPEMRAALGALVDKVEAGDDDAAGALRERFSGPLAFGTAGLRGEVGPGESRMNRVTVARACHGLGLALLETFGDTAREQGVAVGFDARRMSRRFAEDTAEILCGLGIRVHIFDGIVPTPHLAYTVGHLGCVAGVMVTASHNPPRDNGYKVYWQNGAQIVPPVDGLIAGHIAQAPPVPDMPRALRADAERAGLLCPVAPAVIDTYFAAVRAASTSTTADRTALRIVTTPMHGTGHLPVFRALRAQGFVGITAVPSQAEPDGAFPTVAFPNPEEPGAMDRAFALAEEVGAHCVLANDPDTDRLAVGVKDRAGQRWVRLTGNQVGVLLGAHLLAHFSGDKPLLCTTLVSSSMLGRIAKSQGALFAETLTGFKWIANTAMDMEEREGASFVFGYEEALGYACGPLVRDKDGVSATVRMAELLADLLAQGVTVWDRLDELALAHGLSEDASWSVKRPGASGQAELQALMARFRQTPPSSIAGEKVVRTRDLLAGTDTAGAGGQSAMSGADVLTFWTDRDLRLTVRPSGTEPKVKFYLDAATTVDRAEALDEARAGLLARIEKARAELNALVG